MCGSVEIHEIVSLTDTAEMEEGNGGNVTQESFDVGEDHSPMTQASSLTY